MVAGVDVPIVWNGRTNLIGGSVIEYTTSRTTRTGPDGVQERAKTCTQSTTSRISIRPRKTKRMRSRMEATGPTSASLARDGQGQANSVPKASGRGRTPQSVSSG